MRTKILSTLALSASLLTVAGAASAQFYLPNAFYPNGYYLGGGLGYASIDLGTLNLQKGAGSLKDEKPSNTHQPGAVIKFGYAFKRLPVQLDLSYQQLLDFNYDTSPLFTGGSSKLSSTITSRALFANVTLNGNFGYPVIPFITGGIGAAMNTTDMTYAQQSEHSQNTFREAWQLGLGTHVKLTDNLLFDLAAYHQDLGKLTWGPWGNNPTYQVGNDELSANQIQLGLTYVFGDQHIPPSLINS